MMPSDANNAGGRRIAGWRMAAWGGIVGLILLPAVAMQFTREVAWTATDFVFAAVLLIGAGLLVELVLWKVRGTAWRIGICLAVLAAVLLIWADGAVGIF